MSHSLGVRSLTVRAGGAVLVQDASFDASGMTALLGPNGAGKSTMLRAILGLLPASGSVRFGGEDILALTRRDRARKVAFVEQSATTEERVSVRDVIALGRLPHQSVWQARPTAADEQIVAEAVAEVGLAPLGSRQFATLSGGEQQRVLLARALAQQPKLLVLDEPTSHLDIHAQLEVLELLRRKAAGGMTVFLALHDLNLAAAFCNRVVVMAARNVVAQGDPDHVLSPALISQVYGVAATRMTDPVSGRPVIVYQARESR